MERRKNQKLLVQACKELDMPVVVVGKIWDKKYYEEILNIGYKECYFLGPIYNRKLLFSAYKSCSVFALPSTLETPGIAAMEAAFIMYLLLLLEMVVLIYILKIRLIMWIGEICRK